MGQPLPFRDQAINLEQIQELDLKIDQLKRNRDSLPIALRTLDQTLSKAQAGIDAKKKALEDIEKAGRQTKAALDLNNDRLTRSTSRLEQVANSQEYQAVQKEIEQLHKLNASLEEQSKKSVSDAEGVNKELGQMNEQLEKINQERDAQSQALSGQSGELEAQIASLLDERKKYSVNVEARILAQYDRVRMARSGLGFVPALGGRCKGCNMVIPPQMFNEIQKGNSVHTCPSCHRILFVPNTTATSPSAEAQKL